MNDVWSWDFVVDTTESGRQLKWLTIVDEFTHENLCLEVEHNMTSENVFDLLHDLFRKRGLPQYIRSDNGPEFIATAIRTWLARRTK